MKRLFLGILLILIVLPAGAQTLCDDCSPIGSFWCEMLPETCAACWDTCVDELPPPPPRRPGRRIPPRTAPVDPNLREYGLQRTVGVTQLAYEVGWQRFKNEQPHPYARWTTQELVDDVASHGISALKLWYMGDPFDGTGSWCWSPYYWGRDVTLCEDCEAMDSELCEMFPDECQECLDTCVDEPPEPFSCAFGNYGLDDMMNVWSDAGIDTFVLRLSSEAWSVQESTSCSPSTSCNLAGISFANEPTYDIARTFLERYGDIDATIIIGDWEQDWAIRGQASMGYDDEGFMLFPWADAPAWYSEGCIEELGYQECGEQLVSGRGSWVRRMIMNRQAGVLRARAEHPGSALKVAHAVIFNKYPANFDETDLGLYVIDLILQIPKELRPDYIGLSFWYRRSDVADALTWAERKTGYPRNRFYVDELGEHLSGRQYDRIYDQTMSAWCWGVDLVNVWMWKQTWFGYTNAGNQKNHGLFEQLNWEDHEAQEKVQFGPPRPGYYAIQDLINNPIDCSWR